MSGIEIENSLIVTAENQSYENLSAIILIKKAAIEVVKVPA